VQSGHGESSCGFSRGESSNRIARRAAWCSLPCFSFLSPFSFLLSRFSRCDHRRISNSRHSKGFFASLLHGLSRPPLDIERDTPATSGHACARRRRRRRRGANPPARFGKNLRSRVDFLHGWLDYKLAVLLAITRVSGGTKGLFARVAC